MLKKFIFLLILGAAVYFLPAQPTVKVAIDAYWEQLLPSRPWLSLRILRLCQEPTFIKVRA